MHRADDGIRDYKVTGVQTCALPISDRDTPTVLAAHIHVQGSQVPSLFRISEQESIVFAETDLPTDFAYLALGHIHQPHCQIGRASCRERAEGGGIGVSRRCSCG